MDVSALVKKVTSGAQGTQGTLSSLMNSMGGQTHAGFNNLLSTLNNNGLADQVRSWVAKGDNQNVSREQVASALGPDKLNEVAKSTGLSQNEVADHLAQQLPTVVDKLTPDGSVPDETGLEHVAGRVIAQ
jgi:uncharacterized protein YidB (DUF937 family)